ncbi:protein NLP2-like isoform X2 [Canna indica]|uniref:Protein NLP2-like isoform X2 n=1 Tax=Canna indica TaxID=4628 RepID=A0AAQ3KV80_9LILI|nr:protein NLP2-like isoform X2 [Canna indica]
MDGFTPFHSREKSPEPNDLISHLTEMNIETFTELLNPSITDQVFAQFGYSTKPNFQAQRRDIAPTMNNASNNMDGVHSSVVDKSPVKKTIMQSKVISSFPPCQFSDCNENNKAIPKPATGASLAQRLLKALSFFKESTGGGILVQVWMPCKHGEEYVLTTAEQPFLLDQILAGYREVSRMFTFSARESSGSVVGLPGRVFISGIPEWTSNIMYYNRLEYLRVDHALKYEVRGSLALPIFDANENSCCAVLELVTKKEKPNFQFEVDFVCNALQAVNLKSVKPHATRQVLSLPISQRSAFTEILNVLTVVCHAHMLPLALTWVPFNNFDLGMVVAKDCNREVSSRLKKETVLCIQESACYVNDQKMLGFIHVCSESYLHRGQGIVGKAIQSNRPIFSSDIKVFDVHQYPLAHHARKFGLHAAVAIRLRSTYTGIDDYILEFFLPVNCRGSNEQQLLLNSLSITLRRICRSLRTASDAEGAGLDDPKISIGRSGIDFSAIDFSEKFNQAKQSSTKSIFDTQTMESDNQGEAAYLDQIDFGARKHVKKSNSMVEKNVTVSVLQKYYSGTLKDAAKSIGVCPTTLKRICRQNGISRWPSRKIKKVNHSVQKIQSVIDSVPGVMGKLRYNPSTGSLITEVSSSEKEVLSESSGQGTLPMHSTKGIENNQFVGISDTGNYLVGGSSQIESSSRHILLDDEQGKAHDSLFDGYNNFKFTCSGGFSNLAKDISNPDASGKGITHPENREYHIVSRSSSSKLLMEEMPKENGTRGQNIISNRISECRYPSCSNRTDSSSCSASSGQTIKKSVELGMMPIETSKLPVNSGSAITVKASYKEDMVRFKFYPSMCCSQLFEEIGRRFNLSIGTFQLKYKDDEDEWVMLVDDSDLQECIEILESCESQCVRLLVGDLPSVVGSSGSSNSLFLKP